MSALSIPEPTWKAGPLDSHTHDFYELCDEAVDCLRIAMRAETPSARRVLVESALESLQRALGGAL